MTESSDRYPVVPDLASTLRGPTLQEATAAWVAFVQAYYERSPNRSDLTQVFMRGFFAGWSEREVASLADQLAENNRRLPCWPTK